MRSFLPLLLLICPIGLFGQVWVAMPYDIQTDSAIVYGTTTDFAGTPRPLDLDISYPTNDDPPDCGRPLMVIVHGGAWIAGDKNQDLAPRLRQDFAKRGYVTASVNYRLGMFHTEKMINCNVDGWNCFNMTDSSEWYRANYRGIQDVHGAIRYLINHAGDYQIDSRNVFVVGESAGGFIAMGVGFLDDPSEVLDSLVGAYPDAPAPNAIYENACIRGFGLALDIDSMDLSRPALGDYAGTLNPTSVEYTIRGVGNIYGGAFNDIFRTSSSEPPALYLYHQPCDLIVPYNRGRLLAGYQDCLMGFPFNCGFIINRPLVYGSRGIVTLIDSLQAQGLPAPDYYFDHTNNQFSCLQQTDPALVCHAIDAYLVRTTDMANFFSEKVDLCVSTSELTSARWEIHIFPNPASINTSVRLDVVAPQMEVKVFDLYGKLHHHTELRNIRTFDLDVSTLSKGVYILNLRIEGHERVEKLIVQ